MQLISRAEASKWFEEVVPALANLLLRLPSLLESHYQDADYLFNGVRTGLRLLGSQEAGIVFLGQVSQRVWFFFSQILFFYWIKSLLKMHQGRSEFHLVIKIAR
jgi:hypothetical protein